MMPEQTNPVPQPELSEPTPSGADEPAPPISTFADPHSRLAPYFLQASHLAIVAMLAVAFVLVSRLPLWHTDVWGHMKFGQWMVEHGKPAAFEEGDRSFGDLIDTSQPYVNYQWLAQVALYQVYRVGEWLAGGEPRQQMEGGVAALRALTALIFTLKLLLLAIAFRRVSGSSLLAAVGVFLAAAFSVGHFVALRPQVFGELCFAGMLVLLSRPQLTVRGVILITAIMVLWANLHGSFLVGLAVLGACMAGRGIEVLAVERKRVFADLGFRRLVLAVAGSAAAAGLLNPHGPWLYVYAVELSGHPNIAYMDEWKPIWFHTDGVLLYLFGATIGLLAITQYLSPKWFSPTQVLLILGIGVQTLLHQRMVSWWTMLVPWIILPHWAEILKPFPKLARDPSRPDFYKTVLCALLVWLGLMFSSPMSWFQEGRPPHLDQALTLGTPYSLADQLKNPKSNALPALRPEVLRKAGYPNGEFTGRIFASETQGDYLHWALGTDYPVFVHTHVHLFPPKVWREAVIVKNAREAADGERGWREVLDDPDYGINMVIFEPEIHPDLTRAILRDWKSEKPTWRVVRYDQDESEKPSPKDRHLIAIRMIARKKP